MAVKRKVADPPPPKAISSGPQGQPPKPGRPAAPEWIRGRVILWAEKANLTLVLRHFELPQVLNERTGGWEPIDRPFADPVLHWGGYKVRKIRLILLVDRLFEQKPIDDDLDGLRALTVRDGLKTPPSLMVIGKVPYRGVRWVVDDLAIEELDHLSFSGQCCRAKATVDLMAYSAPSDTTAVDPHATALTKAQTHYWKPTDTLHDLAELYLGDAARFNSIRAANPTIKSFANLPEGKRIKIPSRVSAT